jgi:hypothetical protein
MREAGRIVEHPLGPGRALYEICDDDPLAIFVHAVDAQHETTLRL